MLVSLRCLLRARRRALHGSALSQRPLLPVGHGSGRNYPWWLRSPLRRPYLQVGDFRPGEFSHSFMWEVVSACRALRISLSRSPPGRVPRASFRRRCATSTRRLSRGSICLKPRRCCCMALLPVRVGRERDRRSQSPIECHVPGGDYLSLRPKSGNSQGKDSRGRGRDEDCSSPPAQIPACAANAPGSSLGSDVVQRTI